MEIILQKAANIDIDVTAPPSKSYTHRALIIGSLAADESTIIHPLKSEDTIITLNNLQSLGISTTLQDDTILIRGSDGALACKKGLVLDLRDSGTSLRLLASVTLLCRNKITITGSRRMQERPLGPLVEALNCLGADIRYAARNGYPPVIVSGQLKGGLVILDSSVSSQFVSSILMTAPYATRNVEIILEGKPVSRSYIDITVDIMKSFGVEIEREGYNWFRVKAGTHYRGRNYRIEGDYSSASYFFALAAVCGGRVQVRNLNPVSPQGDRLFLDALEKMGCRVIRRENEVTVEHQGSLQGIEIDMSSSPDTVQTLCMVAAYARTPTVITGISHLRYKESDRIAAVARILAELGGRVEANTDHLTIHPARLHGGVIDPGNDHRTAMSAAVLGLAVGDITIRNAECVGKSFPEFWHLLSGVGLR